MFRIPKYLYLLLIFKAVGSSALPSVPSLLHVSYVSLAALCIAIIIIAGLKSPPDCGEL